jgi:hypothetical protein
MILSLVLIRFISIGQVYVNNVDMNTTVKQFELHLAKKPFSNKECLYVDYGQNFKEHFYDLKGQGIEDSTHTQFKKGEYIKLLNYLDSQGWTKDSQREGELGDVKINIILFKRK